MKSVILILVSLISMSASADIFYRENSIVPAALQEQIATLIAANCNVKPHWRIFESENTEASVDGNYSVMFNAELYDLDEMHPYNGTIVVSARPINGVVTITGLASSHCRDIQK